MASEWQTVGNTKKKSKRPEPITGSSFSSNTDSNTVFGFGYNASTNKSAVKTTSSITKYTDEQIYNFKKINKDQMVSYELSVQFDKINDMFRTSTQYLESKKKINYNQFNHNRWELKKEEDNGVINIVCIGLNKITYQNSQDIIKEIEAQEIVLFDDLEKLTEKIIHKCIGEAQFIKLYVQVIKHIMLKCSWIVDDQNMVPVTFRRILLNQLEMRFSNLINDVKNMKYEDSESELIVIHCKQRKGLMALICELYVEKIIGNQLIRYIFRNLETAYETTGLDEYLEYWLAMLKVVMNIWVGSEKQYLDEQIQYIKSKDIKTLKIKFLLDDILVELEKKSYKFEAVVLDESYDSIQTTDAEEKELDLNDTNYDTVILSHGEYETTDSWYESLQDEKDLNWDKFLLDLLQFTLGEKSELELVKKLLLYLVNSKNIYKPEQVKDKIEYIRKENDFSEYRYYLKDLEQLEQLV